MKKPKGKVKHSSNEAHSDPVSNGLKKATKVDVYTDDYFEMPAQVNDKWYMSVPPEPEDFPSCPSDLLNKLKEEAKTMLDSETNGYNIKSSKNSQQNWMRTVMAKGTGRDKIAAFTLMVQEKPLYNLQALKSLLGLVKPGKKESIPCIETLTELFTTDLLPPNTKLKRFAQRPLTMLDELSSGNPSGRRRRLVLWYFEDQLKDMYREFIDSVKNMAAEAIEANKEKAVRALAGLLESHPEQEALLLSNLVNKMGDPSKKVGSKALNCMIQVLNQHPNMKGVIIDEVQKLLFRPNIGQRAKYYSICFLSQIMFARSDAKIAANLIKIYFGFFKACVKLGDLDSKMLSVLLTGVNRAYPFAKDAMDSIAAQLDTLYKVVHIAPFHVSLQALTLLFQVADYKSNVSDRFYSVLYRKLLDPALGQTSHAPMFLNLTFQALKKDESIPRVRALMKRLLQVCCYFPVPMVCATLYMVSQLIKNQAALSATKFVAHVKKEMDNSEEEQPVSQMDAFLDDDSGDEHYEDVPLEVNEASNNVELVGSSGEMLNEDGETKPPISWVHKPVGKKQSAPNTFDPLQRNPLYARGELCCYAELCLLSQHYHPTVALFANQVMNSELITYSGDPLKDFTLMRFLERFSFKNPKKLPESTSKSRFAKRQNYQASGLKGLPVTSKAYLKQNEEKIPVDERYLFRYLRDRRVFDEETKVKDEDSDAESVGSDEFEEMLEGIMKKRGFKEDYDEEEDFGDTDVDFADEFSKNMSSKKSKKKNDEEDDEDDSDGEDFEDGDDEDMDGDVNDDEDLDEDEDLEGDEDMPSDEDFDFDNIDDDDAEDIDFDDDSEEEGAAKGKRKKKGGMDSNVFASAEEFSELLEAASSAREGSSAAVSNKDKASMKQLNWEAERDRWVKGFKNFTKGGVKVPVSNHTKGGKSFSAKKKGKPLGVKKSSFKAKKKNKRN